MGWVFPAPRTLYYFASEWLEWMQGKGFACFICRRWEQFSGIDPELVGHL
jgi:hypothetical protein